VLHITASLQLCFLVTLITEFAAFPGGLESFLGGRRVVAFLAGNFDHLWMHARFQKLGLQRRMGIMAAIAGCSLHRITCMCLFEGSFITFMAGQTKGDILGFEKISLIRTVGEMAVVAGLFYQYLVHHFLFIFFLFVALVTKFTAFSSEKMVRLGCVGIVTSDAFFFFQSGVHYRFVKSYLLFLVAGIAHLIPLLLEYQTWNYSVTEVAFFALLLLDYRVHTFHLEVFIGEGLVTI
jgi:hypothetical protein